jgi:hypothetical protein
MSNDEGILESRRAFEPAVPGIDALPPHRRWSLSIDDQALDIAH